MSTRQGPVAPAFFRIPYLTSPPSSLARESKPVAAKKPKRREGDARHALSRNRLAAPLKSMHLAERVAAKPHCFR